VTAKLLYGDSIVYKIKEELKKEILELQEKKVQPCLAVCLVGDDPASAIYVRNKETGCAEVGIKSIRTNLPSTTTTEELVKIIKRWNADSTIHGILVQLPLPPQINRWAIFDAVHPDKDVDGFHPLTIGKLCQNRPCLVPCTPAGIIELLKYNSVETKGKRAVIVNRSLIVGEPLSLLLASEGPYGNATVTICHEHTQRLKKICRSADILITAVGKRPDFVVRANMVKKDAVIIDVGISRVNGRIQGDADMDVRERASMVSVVPGGCGIITVACLLRNAVQACKIQAGVIDAF